MMTLITGGSKCGKSSLAETLLDSFTGQKFYLATMKPFGEEAAQAIARHQSSRRNRNFKTIEKYMDIHELTFPENSAVLLECMGNLCANEMFQGNQIRYPVFKIITGVITLKKQVSELVIVTNQVSHDGIVYPEGTQSYLSAMGELNRELSGISDNLIECVFGIPVVRKGSLPC